MKGIAYLAHDHQRTRDQADEDEGEGEDEDEDGEEWMRIDEDYWRVGMPSSESESEPFFSHRNWRLLLVCTWCRALWLWSALWVRLGGFARSHYSACARSCMRNDGNREGGGGG